MIYRRDKMVEDQRSEVHGGAGKATLTYLIERNAHPNLRLLTYMSVEPGATIGLHHHRLETEYYVVLKGSVIVDDNGTNEVLHAGDLLQTARASIMGCRTLVTNRPNCLSSSLRTRAIR